MKTVDPFYITLLMYGAGFVMAAGLAYWFWGLYGEYQVRKHQLEKKLEAEDAAFERATLRQVLGSEEPPTAPPPEPAMERAWEFAPPPAEVPPPPPPAPITAPPMSRAETATQSPKTLEELVKRLQQIGIIEGCEGKLAMPIPPDGLIYRLRSGGLALLLPRVEGDAFLAHQCRRYDHIFALTSTGEVLVITRMQQALVHLLDAPTAEDPAKFRALREMDLT